jgi:hypothetical protein
MRASVRPSQPFLFKAQGQIMKRVRTACMRCAAPGRDGTTLSIDIIGRSERASWLWLGGLPSVPNLRPPAGAGSSSHSHPTHQASACSSSCMQKGFSIYVLPLPRPRARTDMYFVTRSKSNRFPFFTRLTNMQRP